MERFWSHVDASGECWLWTGHCQSGYGRFYVDPSTKERKGAHRWLYEWFHGELPASLQLDHLCRVRNCVNLDHLEPVTAAENIRRGETGIHQRNKTHCPQAHEYTEANTIRDKKGHRKCRTCVKVREAKKLSGWERQRIAARKRDAEQQLVDAGGD